MRRTLAVAFALVALQVPSVRAQTPEQVDRLATLGKVWGFLKYYHPAVAAGTLNWDSAVVAVVPRVKASQSAGELQAALESMLDAAGQVESCGEPSGSTSGPFSRRAKCVANPPDSLLAALDLGWTRDEKVLGRDVVKQHERAMQYIQTGR